MRAFVYVIRHVASGMSYVGKTRNPKVRWQQHRTSRKNSSPHLHSALKRHGSEAFIFAVVASCASEDKAYETEKCWISMLRSNEPSFGYNLSSGGRGGTSGITKSPEHRAKIALAHKGKTRSTSHVEAMRRVAQSPEKGRKISLRKKGVRTGPMHPTTRAALIASNRNRVWSAESRAKAATAGRARATCSCLVCGKCKGRERMRLCRSRRRNSCATP